MKLQRPDIPAVVVFVVLISVAVVVSVIHTYLLALTHDAGSIEWMNVVSSTAGISSLGVLGLSGIRRNGQ